MSDDDFLSQFAAIFPAKLTATTTVSSVVYYTWTEQSFSASTGTFANADSPRNGVSNTLCPLIEMNGIAVTTPCFAWIRLRGIVGGQPFFEFAAPSGGGGSTLTVTNGSTTVSSVSTIEVDSTNGLTLTNDSGKAKIGINPASVGGPGIITTAAQTLGGTKTFGSGIVTTPSSVFQGQNNIADVPSAVRGCIDFISSRTFAATNFIFGNTGGNYWVEANSVGAGGTTYLEWGPTNSAANCPTGGFAGMYLDNSGNLTVNGALNVFGGYSAASTSGKTTVINYTKTGGAAGTLTFSGGILTNFT